MDSSASTAPHAPIPQDANSYFCSDVSSFPHGLKLTLFFSRTTWLTCGHRGPSLLANG